MLAAVIGLVAALGATPPTIRTAHATPHDGAPKILLHRMAVATKNQCGRGTVADCREAVTSGSVGSPSFLYLMAARGTLESVASVEVGLVYQSGQPVNVSDRLGIDVLSWTKCASLEFPTPGVNSWPAPGGGNVIVWDAVNACQLGETAVAGYFYVSAYSADVLRLIARPASGIATVTDCSAVETQLDPGDLGMVRFSAGGLEPGCNPCLGPCTEEPPACRLSATVRHFGTVGAGGSWQSLPLTISNNGGGILAGSFRSTAPEFTASPAEYSLGPSQSATIQIQFRTPAVAGAYSGSIDAGNGCPPVVVSASTAYMSECYPHARELYFGVVPIGERATRSVAIENTGQLPLSGRLTSNHPEISFPGGDGFLVDPGVTASITVAFRPSAAGFFDGRMDASACGTILVSGYGDDALAPVCTTDPTILDFGPMALGQEAYRVVLVRNEGGGCIRLSPSLSCLAFGRVFGGGEPVCGGSSRQLEVIFRPIAIGTYECTLLPGGSGCPPVTLRGEGRLPAAGVFTPSLVEFGAIPPGSSARRTISLTNTGTARISGTLIGVCGVFSVLDAPTFSLAPGESREYLIRFQPTEAGDFRCTVDAGESANPLQLTGTAEPPVGVQPATWSAIKSRFGR